MKTMLLAAAGATAALCAAPTTAQDWSGSHGGHSRALVGNPTGTSVQIGVGQGCFDGRCGFDRRGNRSGQTDVVMDVYGGEWALYNNRSWNSASYNDWWHDQPWRAYPAWVRHNQGCARMWYAADTLRC